MKKLLIQLVFIIIFTGCQSNENEHPTSKSDELKSQKLDSLLSLLHKKGKFNGNVLIDENSEITFEKSYGYSNQPDKKFLNKNSLFYIASITKEFTATAIVLLKEKEKITYKNKITEYIPELTQYRDISIRNLLNHTSGIGNLDVVLDDLYKKEFRGLRNLKNIDLVNVLIKYKPKMKSEPSEKYEYSNVNYHLLAIVIEKISGLSYTDFIRENIFKPLKMKNTFIEGEKITSENLAQGHYVEDSLKTIKLAKFEEDYERFRIREGILGGKGIYSTTQDLLIWANSFKNNELISKNGFNEMTARATLINNSETDYGFGFELGYWKDYSSTISHRGRWPGYTSLIEYNSTNEKTIIILQNFDNHLPVPEINDVLYNVKPVEFITLSKSETDKFIGEYKASNGSTKKVVGENDKIYVYMNPSVKLELRPISTHKFIVIGFNPEVEYEFIENNDKVIKFIVRQPKRGIMVEGDKIRYHGMKTLEIVKVII